MRLETLELTRYGRFTDKRIDFAPPAADGTDLHILYGPNEAGKSTLFSAFMDLLFGIQTRTRYDFLHPGPTMQIGARLSEAGRMQELRRLKRNGPSLFDGHGAALPEPVLQAMLGGLSRDGYGAMFSLDDDTIEKGGESILASRGDLGEMLFSASAGLAELGPRLNAIRAELDAFYNGKRSGSLIETKKQLTELQSRRRAIEVSASAVKGLTREAEASEAAWRAARAAEDQGKHELDALQALAASLPLWQRHARLAEALAPLADLPRVEPGERQAFEAIAAQRQALIQRGQDRALRLAALAERIAGVRLDPTVLDLAASIAAAEALRSEHDTALRDLPRRAEEAETARLRLRQLLAELGATGAEAADLLLPAPRLAQLRGLLQARSGVFAAVDAAQEEAAKARQTLIEETLRLGEPGPEVDDAALAALVAAVKQAAPLELRLRAREGRDAARLRLDQGLAALAPWRGTAEALAALDVPLSNALDAWEAGLETARRAEAEALRDLEELGRRQAALRQRRAQDGATGQGFSLADAAAARSRRETLWAAHRAGLNAETAARFEQALREDDQITALLAEALAAARRAAQEAEEAGMLATRAEELTRAAAEASAGRAAILARIAAAVTGCGLPESMAVGALRGWLASRDEVLGRARELAAAEGALSRAETALTEAGDSLSEAMGLPAGRFELIWASATTRVEAAARQRETRRRLASLSQESARREARAQAAVAARAAWLEGWREASAGHPVIGPQADGATAGPLLDRLDELGNLVGALAVIEDRMAKMVLNRDGFQTAKAGVLQALSLPEMPWPDLLQRLRQAEDAARDHGLLSGEQAAEARQDAEDQAALQLLEARAEALGAALGWQPATGSLAEHLERCLQAGALRREIGQLEDELGGAEAPGPESDPEALRSRVEALRAEHQLQRDATERCHAAHLRAVQALEAVGGDEALARIGAERAALLAELEEQSRRHLAARFGLIAVEKALARYRDAHRSAMLSRASQAFERLSRGAYSGLAAQPEGQTEVLVAISAGGAAKLADDLSKGTRFQLYLALRIAGYHELALSRPTVPFIADDIMETFDDGRSLAAFGLLSEMSRAGQVIYLTHHRHLCDLAREASPSVRIIDLTTL